jgi:hypothetical protein
MSRDMSRDMAGDVSGEVSGGSDATDLSVVPPARVARVDAALVTVGGDGLSASPTPDVCVAAGAALLDEVLRGAGRDRATALDLLAADALVTRAFELAASRPGSLETLARGSMRRIAALVDVR